MRHASYGYGLTIHGKRERRFSAEWQTRDQALDALRARRAEAEVGQLGRPVQRTLGELADEYLTYKGQQGKRSLAEDGRILTTQVLPALGKDTPVRRLTAPMIAQYERQRAGEVSAYTVALEFGDPPAHAAPGASVGLPDHGP